MAFDFNDLEQEIQGAAYELFLAAAEAHLFPRLTSGRRTSGQQLKLWKNYLKGTSRFPALPPGLSPHEYGIAFDMVTSPFESLPDVGYTWETWGGQWGGEGDPIHFEIPGARRHILKHLSWSALVTGIDFAISFLPVVGAVSTGAAVLQLFPRWSRNAVLRALSEPLGTLSSGIVGKE